MMIREAEERDFTGLMRLYAQFGKDTPPETDGRAAEIWRDIMADKNHHVIVCDLDGAVVSSCVLVIIPNLTHGARPYGVVENVITDEKHRNRGFASSVLQFARGIALRKSCYKLMLMTGSKLESTLRFYEKAGYNNRDKTAFIQWL